MITSLSIGRGGLGRTGNMLWTIAGVIGIATKNGQPYGFNEPIVHDNALFGGAVDNLNDYFLNRLPPLIPNIEYKPINYFWGYQNLHLPTGSWTIDCHLQAPRYFSHCIDLVRRHLTFKNEPPRNNKVAIHWRASDYQCTAENPNAYHPRLTIEYYEKAMANFPKGTKYILFSDEPERAMNMFEQSDFFGSLDIMPSNTDHYIEDFKLMKSCHSFITANSTFSLMAAILADQPGKKIVCPKNWFGPHVNLETKDIYPQGAIII